MRYLTLGEVLELHRLVLAQTGGATGLRDLGALESAVGQPRQRAGQAGKRQPVGEDGSGVGGGLQFPRLDGSPQNGERLGAGEREQR